MNVQIPFHFSCVAHPFRMGGSLLRRDPDTSRHMGFRAAAVSCLQIQRSIHRDGNPAPWEKTVQLALFPPPESHIYHTVGRPLPSLPALRIIPDDDRFLLSQSGIAEKIFDIKGLALSGFGMLGGEGMPPPVIALFRQRSPEHTVVTGEIAFVHENLHSGASEIRTEKVWRCLFCDRAVCDAPLQTAGSLRFLFLYFQYISFVKERQSGIWEEEMPEK
mgnify:CR=1 FL=1